MTLAEISAIEPGISAIIDEARTVRETTHADDRWPAYSYLRGKLSRLVGWTARRPELPATGCPSSKLTPRPAWVGRSSSDWRQSCGAMVT